MPEGDFPISGRVGTAVGEAYQAVTGDAGLSRISVTCSAGVVPSW